jgi:hypothetical protein
MLNLATKTMAKAARDKWWKVASKKTVETAVRLAKSDAGKEAARIALDQGTRKIFEKQSGRPPLKKSHQKLDKMRKKGLLRQEEYEILRKQLIESADVADL